METRAKHHYEIPSDDKSEDELEAYSEDEESSSENIEKDVFGERAGINKIQDDCDFDTLPLSIRLAKLDGIWEGKSRTVDIHPFTQKVGPKNIPEHTKSPIDFFFFYFLRRSLRIFSMNLISTVGNNKKHFNQ